MSDKTIEEIYCNKDVGTSLYQDNLLGIERVELIGDIFRLYANNEEISNDFIKKLDDFKNKGAFYSIKKIDEFLYSKDFIEFLYTCKVDQNQINEYLIRDGIFSKGYLDKTYNINYSKDLRPCIEMTLIIADILVPVICLKNKVFKSLSYNSSMFMNNIQLKENNLLIGLDSGYLIYLNKDKKCNLYIYEENIEYVKFFKENILSKLDNNLNIIFLDSLEYEDILKLNIDNIIIDNSVDIDINLKHFMEFKLYNFLNILYVDNINVYFNKLRIDLRDIIMSNEEKFTNVLLENFKDFKGIDSHLLSAELDFVEKCGKFLKENQVYYDSYKKISKDLNNNDFLLNILKNY